MRIFSDELVAEAVRVNHVADLSHATIGETLLVAQYLEKKTGIPFIRMDQGSPGLPANRYGIEAEKRALDSGIGSQYPAAAGITELKEAASRPYGRLLCIISLGARRGADNNRRRRLPARSVQGRRAARAPDGRGADYRRELQPRGRP